MVVYSKAVYLALCFSIFKCLISLPYLTAPAIPSLERIPACLLFADDIALMSESAQGSQQCLNKLAMYCNKWNLSVNTSTTKVMIFNKGGYKMLRFNFILCDSEIDVAQDYTHLGILFSSSGPFTKALCDKTFRAFFKLRQLDSRNNALMTLELFDTLVTPKPTYGYPACCPTLLKESSADIQSSAVITR